MSRITGTDAWGMMEAYNAIYTPEEISEEQIWEEVEAWVNSLVEEGNDLSEFTWEEMYEAYITEIGVNFGGQAAVDKARAQQKDKSASDAKLAALRTQRFGSGGSPSASKPSAAKPAPSGTTSRFAGARDAAFAKAKGIKGSPVVGPKSSAPSGGAPAPAARPSGSAPAAKPAAAKPAAAKPAATTAAKPAAPAPGTKAAGPESIKPKTPNPLMQKTFGYQSGQAPDQKAAKASSAGSAAAKMDTSKITKTAFGGGSLMKEEPKMDLFDIVLEYLVSEGYAETNENALVIMANMSEEWKEEIIEGSYSDRIADNNKRYDRARKRAAQRAAARNEARAKGQTGSVPGVGYVSPRRERETYTDSSGTERHKSGAKAK
jgi:hypothetical protein